MDAQERRQAIARRLERARSPVSATALAREFSVSRQIIVGDVAILRAGARESPPPQEAIWYRTRLPAWCGRLL